MKGWFAAGFLVAVFMLSGEARSAEKRIALVVGNSAYAFAGRLSNPVNDASDVAAALKRLGFNVTPILDASGDRFAKAANDFLTKANGADIALFYYAGHGLQYDGAPYLLPTDAKLENEFAIKRETIAAQDMVTALESSAHASIVLLDACRNNPLAEQLQRQLSVRGRGAVLSRGLGRVEAASGNTLVVYAAGPGQVAQDGTGRNSPFTTAFLKNVETPGLEVEQMLKRVTADVETLTGGKQQPERLSRLKIELWLKQGAADNEAAALRQRLGHLEDEIRLRNEKTQSSRYKLPASYGDYIGKYPFDSTYVDAGLAQRVEKASYVRTEWAKAYAQNLNETNMPYAIQRILSEYSFLLGGGQAGSQVVHDIKMVGKHKTFGEEVYVVAAYSNVKGRECHQCKVEMSLFEFTAKQDGWHLGTVGIGLGQYGGWGGPPYDVKLVGTGSSSYALILQEGFMGQGFTTTNQAIVIPIAGTFIEVLSAPIGEDDSGTGQNRTSWSGQLDFIPNSGYFSEVILTRSGKKDQKELSDSTTYQFDERVGKYIPQR